MCNDLEIFSAWPFKRERAGFGERIGHLICHPKCEGSVPKDAAITTKVQRNRERIGHIYLCGFQCGGKATKLPAKQTNGGNQELAGCPTLSDRMGATPTLFHGVLRKRPVTRRSSSL